MIDESEGKLEGDVNLEAFGFQAVVPIGETLDAQVKEPAEAALVVVLEDGAQADGRRQVGRVRHDVGVVRLGEAEGVGCAHASISLEGERDVVLGQGVVVEDHVSEHVGGLEAIREELVARGQGAGVVAINSGDAQRPGVGEIVAEREGGVPGDGVEGLAVGAVGAHVLCEEQGRAGLDGHEPAVAVLVRGISGRKRPGQQGGRAQQQGCKQQDDLARHGAEVFVCQNFTASPSGLQGQIREGDMKWWAISVTNIFYFC